MFVSSAEGAAASVDSAALGSEPATPAAEPVRHMVFGSLCAVRATIRTLHAHGYAEPNDWSRPVSTGRPNEVMVILTRRVRLVQGG